MMIYKINQICLLFFIVDSYWISKVKPRFIINIIHANTKTLWTVNQCSIMERTWLNYIHCNLWTLISFYCFKLFARVDAYTPKFNTNYLVSHRWSISVYCVLVFACLLNDKLNRVCCTIYVIQNVLGSENLLTFSIAAIGENQN